MGDVYDIAIVGAGICGLTAAVELSCAGHKKILVLEADHEPGGRVKSVMMENGLVVDTGAHWFHGGNKNPFFQWAKDRYELKNPLYDPTDNLEVLWARGGAEALELATARARNIYETAGKPDISLHDLAVLTNDPASADALLYVTREWMATEDPRNARARELFNDPLGYDGWQLPGGIGTVPHAMAAEAASKGVSILYKKCVRSIEQHAGGVKIHCDSGQSFEARHSLVTVSCGVLQENAISFDPDTKGLIQKHTKFVHMGNLAKIIVPVTEEYLKKCGVETNKSFDLIDDHVYIQSGSAGKPTITIYIGGDRSDAVENMKEETLHIYVESILSKLKIFTSWQAHLSGKIIKTSWRSNPLTRGSYAIGMPGAVRTDPFQSGRIVFAGDSFLAQEEDSPGQMAGAFASAMKAIKLFA